MADKGIGFPLQTPTAAKALVPGGGGSAGEDGRPVALLWVQEGGGVGGGGLLNQQDARFEIVLLPSLIQVPLCSGTTQHTVCETSPKKR